MSTAIASILILTAFVAGTLISWTLLTNFYKRKCRHVRETEHSKWANTNSILFRFQSDADREKFLGLLSSEWTEGVIRTEWAGQPDQRSEIILDVQLVDPEDSCAKS